MSYIPSRYTLPSFRMSHNKKNSQPTEVRSSLDDIPSASATFEVDEVPIHHRGFYSRRVLRRRFDAGIVQESVRRRRKYKSFKECPYVLPGKPLSDPDRHRKEKTFDYA